MFDNIGGKIKGVAQFITWVGIILTIILFFILTISGEDELIALSFIILIVGCVGSWLSSIIMYGFGQLIENSDILVRLNIHIAEDQNYNTKNIECDNNKLKKGNEESKEAIKVFISPFHQLLSGTGLAEEKINEVLKLKKMKDDGLLTIKDCKKQAYKIIEDLSIDKVIKILNNL